MTWTLRPADGGDIDALLGLVRDSMSGIPEVLFGLDGMRARLTDPALGPGLSGCVLAEDGGEVVGERLGYPLDAGAGWTPPVTPAADILPMLRTFRSLVAPGTWYLSSIAVAESHRRQGLGRALLRSAAAAALAAGKAEVSLHVFRGQDAALALYEAAGFTERASADWPTHPRVTARGPLLLMVGDPVRLSR